MKKSSVKSLLGRAADCEGKTQTFYSIYKRMYELFASSANNVDAGSNQGQTTSTGVLDSTASRALDSFVVNFISTICPPNSKWASLLPSDNIIAEISESEGIDTQDVKEQLTAAYQEITDILFDNIDHSNLYSVFSQYVRDVFIGTGTLLIQKSNDLFDSASPLDFTAIPPLDISTEIAANGKQTATFRKRDIKYSEIQYLWPEFNMGAIKNKPNAEEENKFTVNITEACVLEPIHVKTPEGEILKRWRYVVIVDDAIGFEDHFKFNPFATFFWDILSGENMGRGLAFKVFPDVLALEAMTDLKNRWTQMFGFGMLEVQPSKMYNASSAKIRPNAVFQVKEKGAVTPIQMAGSPQVQQLELEYLRQSIKETSLDFQVPEDPRMTATQVQILANQQLKLFAGVLGRIQFQLLWPVIQQSLEILIETGQIKLPAGLSKIDPRTTQLKILSPLGRVQNLNDVEALMVAMERIGQINPELIPDYIKIEDIPSGMFEKTGSPAQFLRSSEETEQIQQQKAQQQQMMMEMEMQKNAPKE